MRSVLNEDFTDVFAQFAKGAAAKATDQQKQSRSYYIGGSISKYTKGLIMSFPVLCDDTLAMDSLMNISKANERNITTMMEMLFASMSINMNKGATGKDIIRMFHKNIDTMPIDDFIDYADDFSRNYKESAKGENLPVVTDAMVREAARDMVDQLKLPQKRFPVNSLSEASIGHFITTFDGRKVNVLEGQISPNINIYDPSTDVSDREKFNYQKQRDQARDAQQAKKDAIDAQQLANQQAQDAQQAKNDQFKAANDLNKKRALDIDYKKANELQPTMLVVNFNTLNDDGDVIDRSSFITGVKCRLIPTTSMDISERLISSTKSRHTFKDFIRATTGETKFLKGFLLNISQMKADARNDAKRGEAAKVWNTLKNRSNVNRYRKLSKDGNDASAITTLVVSKDTVNYMKSVAKVDLESPNAARKLIEEFNLLCLVIADDANEVAKFMYDGNKNFDSLSYSVLSKEANDKALRKELNLLQQARRY